MTSKDKVQALVEAYVAEATGQTTSGGWVWYREDIARFIPGQEQAGQMEGIRKELWCRPEIADVSVSLCGIHGMVIDCAFYLKYCPETGGDDESREPPSA